jgi:hypothetical protein
MTFVELFLNLNNNTEFVVRHMVKRVSVFERRHHSRASTFIELIFKLLLRPNALIPNFSFDLIMECSKPTPITLKPQPPPSKDTF